MGYGKHVTKILYGGDYNPEQWPREVWQEDIRLMKKAHINEVTLNVFNWAVLQPEEDTYCFDQLDEIMGLMRENGFYVCLATSTGAHPAWMAKRYPDILRTEFNGMKRKFGGRHNSCPNSSTYRKYAPKLAKELAKRYKDYDNIVAWHISNEYGGSCYCENCEKAFQKWLKKKYGTLEEMNRCFYTSFWGHTFYDWDEVVVPNQLSEHYNEDRTMFQGISLDYRRFMSESILNCFELEYNAIKSETPDLPVTTNLMAYYKELDYQKWARSMDFISWDNYPNLFDPPSRAAMWHDMMRGIKNQESFVLMEQTPSVANWHPYNRIKRPGDMRLLSYQAIAHGADAVQFFQIRRSIGACEKYHGAVIDHAGRGDTRIFLEIKKLGEELEKLGDIFLEGKAVSQVAILFDWDNWWAVEYSTGPSIRVKYIDAVLDYYTAAFEWNVSVDMISVEDELDSYKVVIAPLLYMVKTEYDEKIRKFVEKGGTFITTYFSGIVEEHDLVMKGGYPGTLKDILGIWVEEVDALPEGEENYFEYNGNRYPAGLLCDLMHLEGAEALSVYGEDFYRGMPVLTKHSYGAGYAYYVGARSNAKFYRAFLKDILDEAFISPVMDVPAGVEAVLRENEKGRVYFLLNHKKEEEIVIDKNCKDLLSDREYKAGDRIILEEKGVLLLYGNREQK